MNIIAILTTFLSVITGFAVIGLGNWSHLTLKFSGIALATVSSTFLLLIMAVSPKPQCISAICVDWYIYQIVRNMAFIIFNIACGRDAIQLRGKERRADVR